MKQTAVEWLVDKMLTEHHSKIEWDKIVDQAKEMEKEQIKDSYSLGWQDGRYWPSKHCFESPTDYYDKTFKSE